MGIQGVKYPAEPGTTVVLLYYCTGTRVGTSVFFCVMRAATRQLAGSDHWAGSGDGRVEKQLVP